MKITTARRISQIVFFSLFLWFCIVSTVGDKFHQIRGWSINLFLWLDPLTGFATIFTTHKLWAPLVLSLITIASTIILGRVFCGWICPFGSIHHFVGYLGQRSRKARSRIEKGKYRKFQFVKYLILFFFIALTAAGFGASLLQTGLLAPIPLATRSVSITLLPVLDAPFGISSITQRYYEGAFLIFTIFLIAVLLNLYIPRFFCRFLCPSGALLGLFSKFKIFDFLRNKQTCTSCGLCSGACTGGCDPDKQLKSTECVMCFNCREICPEESITFTARALPEQDCPNPDISRRGFALSIFSGLLATKTISLAKTAGVNYDPMLIRPPGSMPEEEFQKRCLKCGQCIRVCPTNVLQPAGLDLGFVNLWTPILNNRIGSSGCQLNCVACGQVCPTAAIRPITLDEKLGKNEFEQNGAIKIGTAFVDRNRCLPWAMSKPCIVCEENCPLSPKAIRTSDIYQLIIDGNIEVESAWENKILSPNLPKTNLTTGDYYMLIGSNKYKIIEQTQRMLALERDITADDKSKISSTSAAQLQVRLQRPIVDINQCIGCGTCERECPVSGKRGIRISAEGETRNRYSRLSLE